MSPLKRRPKLPADLAQGLRSKPLAASPLRDGGWLVLTKATVATRGTDVDFERQWHTVDKGEWGEDHHIHLSWVDGTPATHLYLTKDDKVVAALLRELIENSLVHVEFETFDNGAIVRGAIRRNQAGELFSQLSVSGTVPDEPGAQERIRRLETRVRAQVGLPA